MATFICRRCLRRRSDRFDAAPTTCDDVCFWLYSSGSTGTPKGTVHVHSSLIQTAELYARPILGIREDDVVFSAAKLFFAYGLGNALTFPLAVGATAVLMAERATPAAVFKRLKEHRPTIFYGVPTLYGMMLASAELPARERSRPCASAPQRAKRCRPTSASAGPSTSAWKSSTASGRPRCCTSSSPTGRARCAMARTGKPVPGYPIRLVDEHGHEVAPGELGELQINGPTSAIHYWNNRAKSLATFVGPWTRAGDKYSVRRGRLLHLRRALRRHAQGERHVRLAVRGRGGARDASRCARGGGDRRARRERADQAEGVRGGEARRAGRRMRWPRRSSSTSRTGSRRTSIRAGSSSSPSCRRPRPARFSASSCAAAAEGIT